MKPPKSSDTPVIDATLATAPAGSAGGRSSDERIHQQEILAELGVLALQGAPFPELLDQTARLTAEGLQAEFCKVLEYLPAENRLLVRAGIGWDEGIVGKASVGADLDSPAGFALHSGKPVISNHLKDEQRFRTPELLVQHGIRRAMNVILQGDGKPFGVLEVDSRSEGEFGERDIAFLQGAANILGMAIERQRNDRRLTEALTHQKVLLEEINHRAKNSLQLVSSMLQLQAKGVGDAEVGKHLAVAAGRVSAVSRLYARLTHDSDLEKVDLGAYLREVCRDLEASQPGCVVHAEVMNDILLAPEKAVHLGLIVNELVTNACKYAYPGGTGGQVWVRVAQEADAVHISVRDEGVGLPHNYTAESSNGLGMRIVRSLASQLGASLATNRRTSGAEFIVVVPQK
jgi:two-component sensor histidine kinase